MLKLRPYQLDATNQLWDALAREERVLCVLPTASGKSEIFRTLLERACLKEDFKAVVLIKGTKLLAQTAKRLEHLHSSVYAASLDRKGRWGQVIVASIDSLDDVEFPGVRLIICDEAHNLNDGRYKSFLDRHATAKVLGFTATPWRNNRPIYGDGEFFPRIHFQRSVKQMINEGYIIRPISKRPEHTFRTEGLRVEGGDYVMKDLVKLVADKPKIKAQIEDAMPRLEGRRKCVWICTSIEHAEEVQSQIPEPSLLLHSKVKDAQYVTDIFERDDGPRHLVSVMMVKEGYDYPAIDAIILMRPTRSITLMVQIIGRGLRLSQGKENCLVLDYGRVIEHCGPITDPYIIKARAGRGKPIGEITLRVCPKCLSYVGSFPCPDCQHMPEAQRDETKNLERTASSHDVMARKEEPPEDLQCFDVLFSKHKAKSGNDCIRIDYSVTGRVFPISMFGSNFPKSWRPVKAQIEAMTGFRFQSWEECIGAIGQLIPERIPSMIRVQNIQGYDRVIGLQFDEQNRDNDRTRDPDGSSDVVPF